MPHFARNDKLDVAIDADPDEANNYLVYADWLQSHGDPRGELIVLQHSGNTDAAKAHLDAHREYFWGKLADLQDMLEPYPYDPLGGPTVWRWGYLHTAWLSNKHDRDALFGKPKQPPVTVREALGWLLDHGSARFLRELTLGIVSYESNTYDDTTLVIAEAQRPTLRKLILGDFHSEETELNWSTIGNLEPLYASVPNLESLTLRSGSMTLGKIDLPRLRELIIITGGLDQGSLQSVCSASWPALERLSLQLGSDTKFTLENLQPIFDATAFPNVVHLGLGNSTISDAICGALARSKIAAQLESLDLSLGTMGDEGAAALAEGRFPRLAHLDVSSNYLTKQGLAALGGVAKTIESSGRGGRSREGQRDDSGDPDDRYIAAYE